MSNVVVILIFRGLDLYHASPPRNTSRSVGRSARLSGATAFSRLSDTAAAHFCHGAVLVLTLVLNR
jgi:hypothetical protein